MTFFVPIILFGWIPLTVIFFFRLKPHRAVLFSVIGGWLFLPTTGYDLPGIPEFTKNTAIALGLILGGWASGARQKVSYKWTIYDLPMILWCISPFVSSMTNKLGSYDGLSTSFQQVMIWGVPYFAARLYFNTAEKLQDLCLGIVIGGLIYLPLCLYEIRMSPELSKIFYGFFPHSWIQHKRYGGWRPIVFMHHGLMVALWMASSTTALFWLWRAKYIEHIKGVQVSFIVIGLIITTVLCKSANGWFALAIGCGCYSIHNRYKTNLPFRLLLLSVPIYAVFRISGIISGEDIKMMANSIFDAERISSLSIRLLQEDLFVQKALESPLFGWGGYNRGWPIDPITGTAQIKWVDSLWLITFSKNGFLGLFSLLSALLTGPWLIFRSNRKIMQEHGFPTLIPTMLGLVVVLFMIDCLVNGMINPIYTLISGALVGFYLIYQRARSNQ